MTKKSNKLNFTLGNSGLEDSLSRCILLDFVKKIISQYLLVEWVKCEEEEEEEGCGL